MVDHRPLERDPARMLGVTHSAWMARDQPSCYKAAAMMEQRKITLSEAERSGARTTTERRTLKTGRAHNPEVLAMPITVGQPKFAGHRRQQLTLVRDMDRRAGPEQLVQRLDGPLDPRGHERLPRQ
jgi:hypothetical protein